jgi:hypothetical protein
MPGWLYSAAGDGYFESYDYGQTWKRLVAGLGDYDYLFGLAVDSGDPKTVIVSASEWPYKAYSLEDVESLVYRRTGSTQDSDDNNNNVESFKNLQSFQNAKNDETGLLTEKVNGKNMSISYTPIKFAQTNWIALLFSSND